MGLTTDRDKSPYFAEGKWWLPLPEGGAVAGQEARAPKKAQRKVLWFTLTDGRRKKFYKCDWCTNSAGESEWIFHKNFAHQHIPRRHPECCSVCPHCLQRIFREVFPAHLSCCRRRLVDEDVRQQIDAIQKILQQCPRF